MSAFPLAGTTFSSALRGASNTVHGAQKLVKYLYKSYPAARSEPRVGNCACLLSRLMRSFEVRGSAVDSTGRVGRVGLPLLIAWIFAGRSSGWGEAGRFWAGMAEIKS